MKRAIVSVFLAVAVVAASVSAAESPEISTEIGRVGTVRGQFLKVTRVEKEGKRSVQLFVSQDETLINTALIWLSEKQTRELSAYLAEAIGPK